MSNSRDTTSAPSLSRRTVMSGMAGVGGAVGLGAAPALASSDRKPKHPSGHHAQVRVPRLTPRQQAGQRVIASYTGLTPPPQLLESIRQGEVGGVIFFGENITSTPQIAQVTARLRAAHRHSPTRDFPLLLMTDQEGGVVRRLKDQEPTMTAKQLGQQPDFVAASQQAGLGAANGLRAAGMNLNLAPVLDVYRQEGNFDDHFGRSFSNDPGKVAACGTAFLQAQQSRGVAATTKHFPGLGSAGANENTDLVKVVINTPLDELRGVDEAPFATAIQAGVDLVMTSWAVYPALDSARPAGLSQAVVEGELRGRLRFKGVTITDALEAGSLTAYGEVPDLAVQSAAVGMDLLLASSRRTSDALGCVTALAYAREDHRLNARAWNASLQRVLALRAQLRRQAKRS